jgi:hypothetical protein
MARVMISLSSYLIKRTTSAFCPGDTRQQMTASHVLDIRRKKLLKIGLSRMIPKAVASTNKPF